MIPVDALARRRYTFWLMVVYVGGGLGLLLTTSFLGLRMYLRRRKLKMPAAMTGVWLSLGGALIVLLLLGGALLPRPQAEYKVADIGSAGSKSQKAWRSNVKEGQPGEGEGEGKDAGDSKDKGKDKEGRDSRDGNKDKSGSAGNKDKSDRNGKKDRSGSDKDGKKDGHSRDKGKAGDKTQKDRKDEQAKQEEREDASSGDTAPPRKPPQSPSWFKNVAKVLKWVVFGLLALVVAFFAIRAFLQFFANFTDSARNLLDAFRRFWESLLGLFGRKKEQAAAVEDAAEQREVAAAQPFSAFSNPFADGRAERLSPAELAHYTFAALQAWARRRDLGRQSGETPQEFADRVGGEVLPLKRRRPPTGRPVRPLCVRPWWTAGQQPRDPRTVLANAAALRSSLFQRKILVG